MGVIALSVIAALSRLRQDSGHEFEAEAGGWPRLYEEFKVACTTEQDPVSKIKQNKSLNLALPHS